MRPGNDGRGYVLHKGKSLCFPDHLSLGRWLDVRKEVHFRSGGSTSWGSYGATEPNIWHASGSFDAARHARIARAQGRILSTLFQYGFKPEGVTEDQPPAFVRPADMPHPENAPRFHCDLADLINSVGGVAIP